MKRQAPPSSPSPLGLDSQLCFALYSATRAMTRAYGPLLQPLGLTYPQYLVMLVLWEERVAPVKRLGARLRLDSGTLTPLLTRLEALGYVERRRSTVDERVVDIHLTPAGKRLEAKASGVPHALACALGADPEDPEDMAALGELRASLSGLTARIDAAARAQPSDPTDDA